MNLGSGEPTNQKGNEEAQLGESDSGGDESLGEYKSGNNKEPRKIIESFLELEGYLKRIEDQKNELTTLLSSNDIKKRYIIEKTINNKVIAQLDSLYTTITSSKLYTTLKAQHQKEQTLAKIEKNGGIIGSDEELHTYIKTTIESNLPNIAPAGDPNTFDATCLNNIIEQIFDPKKGEEKSSRQLGSLWISDRQSILLDTTAINNHYKLISVTYCQAGGFILSIYRHQHCDKHTDPRYKKLAVGFDPLYCIEKQG